MPPATTFSGTSVTVTWTAPWNGGSSITSYTISFLQSDGVTYTENKLLCNGTQASVVSARSCTMPSASFTIPPYSLAWGSSIYAKVSATNSKGTSVVSQGGNGAIIWTNPDAPISF